ncbi:acyltransferase [Ramlibacter solisilvae]|uniref:Acyltransferase 3 domain-containing protein n=1 Tax=Ramlibacter tataouinensis TaxID=94132 RepID=A0A127JVY1_9BURK|nr:acyltransferase [Ramlibacter tataouinensis]AMO24168.1 hypothetical protein UC35_16650 [Ramlibacter tataouinensis]
MPPPDTRTPIRFEALDGWRGLCACFVVLFHFHGYSPLYSSSLIRNSYLFVDFFFVLSGFVIAYNYASRLDSWQGVKAFFILRLGRLYPLHLAVLLAFVAYETLRLTMGQPAFTGETRPSAVITNLLLLQGLGIHDSLTWNGPSWSISTELWTYVLFALVCLWFGMRDWMLVAAAFVLPLLLFLLSKSGMDTTFDWGYLRCVLGFALGVACWRVYSLAPATRRPLGTAAMTMLELAIVLAVAAFVSAAGTSPLSFMAPFVFAAAVLIFSAEGGLVSRLFRGRVMSWLGMLSYSIYLTHLLVVTLAPPIIKRLMGKELWTAMPLPNGQWVMAFGRNDLEGTLFYGVALAATLALSALTYRWVEVPGRELSRKWLRRPRLNAAAAKPQQQS